MKQIQFDNTQAMTEGWFISEVGAVNDEWRLEKDDEAKIFAKDQDAWLHVYDRAASGSAYHMGALKFLEVNAAREFEMIETHVCLFRAVMSVSELFASNTGTAEIKLAAISARVDGDYDNPALMHFGPLGDTRDDIRRIIMSEVTPDTAMVLNALRTKFTQEGK